MLKAFGEKGRVTVPPMKHLPLIALLAASLFVFEALCARLLAAAPLTSTHAEQTQVSLTIYNSNLGLVKDVREIALAEGGDSPAFYGCRRPDYADNGADSIADRRGKLSGLGTEL